MDKLLSFLKNKTFLTVLAVVLVFLLIPLLSFWSLSSYLKKAVYPDLSLVFYEEAQEALRNTTLAPASMSFLYLVDKAFPEMFLHVPTEQELLNDFDYTKEPATFKVLSADKTNKTLGLRVILPSFIAGAESDSKISCFINSTQAVETSPADDSVLTQEGLLDQEKLDSLSKELSIQGSVFEFISSLLERQDIKSGAKSLELQARCIDQECDLLGEQCFISVI